MIGIDNQIWVWMNTEISITMTTAKGKQDIWVSEKPK